MTRPPTALIAEDEPLLRRALVRMLKEAWPELEVVAEARNGREALERFEALRPQVCFLDVHMPGLSGLDVARRIGRGAHLVFVTAFDQYAVEAFAQAAVDYLVKPLEAERLADTVARLKPRMAAGPGAVPLDELLARLHPPRTLRWLRVSTGKALRLVAAEDVDYLRSDQKYTRVAWRGPKGEPAQGLVRTPLKELVAQLDPGRFAQVHRAVVVNLGSVSHVVRGPHDTGDLHLKNRPEVLPVSRGYWNVFQRM
jgi:DNA-binding LytR/AlgR family response regulator